MIQVLSIRNNIYRSDKQVTFQLYKAYKMIKGPASLITFTSIASLCGFQTPLVQWGQRNRCLDVGPGSCSAVASFTKEVNQWLVKHPLVFNGHLANRGLTFLVKEATGDFDMDGFQATSSTAPAHMIALEIISILRNFHRLARPTKDKILQEWGNSYRLRKST